MNKCISTLINNNSLWISHLPPIISQSLKTIKKKATPMSKTRSLSRISKILTKKKTLSKHPKTTKMNQDLTYQKKRNLFSITQDQRWVLSSQQTSQWWLSSRCSNNNWNSCSANKLNSSSSKETFKLLTSMSRKTHSLKKKKIAIPKLMKKTRSCHPTQSSQKMHN